MTLDLLAWKRERMLAAANKPVKNSKNPKLIIADYYDSLVNQINIYTEEILKKCKHENDPIIEMTPTTTTTTNGRRFSNLPKRNFFEETYGINEYDDTYSEDFIISQKDLSLLSDDQIASPKKMSEHVNLIRSSMIDELIKAEQASFDSYERKKATINILLEPLSSSEESSKVDDELNSMLFMPVYWFLLPIEYFAGFNKSKNSNIFKLYAISTDFYLNSSSLEILR